MSLSSMLTKKSVSSGLATHKMEQQSRVAESFPLSVNLSPTCRPCRAKTLVHENQFASVSLRRLSTHPVVPCNTMQSLTQHAHEAALSIASEIILLNTLQ